jgi:hypothetical protein
MRGAGPSRRFRLTLTGLLALTVAIAVVWATTGSSGGDDDSATVSIGTAVTEPAPAEMAGPDPDAGAEQPAPAGSSPGVWWRPGDDQLDPSLLWVFDPSTNTGYQTEYRPAGLDGPYQHTFSYGRTDAGVRLNFLSVMNINLHKEDLTSLRYDSSAGVLRVNRDGSREAWFGCSSSEMPALAAALC